jgi:hypothetical protein
MVPLSLYQLIQKPTGQSGRVKLLIENNAATLNNAIHHR